ncbi:MAG: serpin family protein [Bacteroidales bacterium]|nr:serpin family protein [Bacteroidales bacterium]
MKKTVFFILTAFSILLATCSCINAEYIPGDDNPYTPLSLSTRQQEMLNTGHKFSFEFLDRIEKDSPGEDYVISPLSMQILLGMILNGAQGKTAEEICSVLGYGKESTAEVNEFCLAMLTQLPGLDKKTKLSMANSIFVDKGYDLLNSYKATVKKYYDAEIDNLDFNDTKGSADIINKWCSDHTNGLIPKILDEVSPAMLCYLLNAMYFKGEWVNKFNANSTRDEAFYRDGKECRKVPMMYNYRKFGYTENDLFQAVSLPYGNSVFSMTVLLPKSKHNTEEITGYLKANGWRSVAGSMFSRNVDLSLPRFETKYHKNLNELLSKMGMPLSFTGGADFSLMSPDALKLSFVQQDAVIKVDEEGAEAAAVSSAGMEKTTAIPQDPPVVFRADHPFIYVISEAGSGAILFAGRYSAFK